MDEIQAPQVPPEVQAAFAPIMKAVGAARAKLADTENIVTIRPGYKYPEGAPVPAVVVAVIPGTTPVAADAMEKQFGVPFTVIDATVEEQMAVTHGQTISFGPPSGSMASAFERMLRGEEEIEFAPPKTGSYEVPEPSRLQPVNEEMELTVCVSPEAGWGELEAFLGETTERLTVAMYQFTAPHIFAAIEKAVEPEGRTLELILHPVPEKPAKSGVKADDLDEEKQVIPTLDKQMKKRFEQTWATLVSKATPDGLFASAYHIKVAVRDGGAIWLSSGNWQSSNQPNVHPFAPNPKLPPQFQRKYNRDYHAIIANKTLADIYEFYIKRDFEESAKQAGQAISFVQPDLFVPAEEESAEEPMEFAAPPRFFEPLRLKRKVSVQPLLTPDNYAAETLNLIRSAKESVWFQNQYINFRGTSDDFPEFRALVGALLDKVKKKLDVRIICRDMMKQESLDVLIALGFPKDVFRFQPACHNKTIIVDRKVVIFGSHNWSNEGVKTNRDASLIFDDAEIASYLAEVCDYDWTTLATAHPTKAKPRVAAAGEETPAGSKRVPFTAIFEDGA
jgi:hypothetical protein